MKTKSFFPTRTTREQGPGQFVNRIFRGVEPSIRVPVTVANRQYLRALRQAELDAWRNAPGGTRCTNPRGEAR